MIMISKQNKMGMDYNRPIKKRWMKFVQKHVNYLFSIPFLIIIHNQTVMPNPSRLLFHNQSDQFYNATIKRKGEQAKRQIQPTIQTHHSQFKEEGKTR